MTKADILSIIKNDMDLTTGCTEPAALAFLASKACAVMGCIPDRVHVLLSPNAYKNGISVGVPGMGGVGITRSIAMGLAVKHSEDNLAMLRNAKPEDKELAEEYLKTVDIGYDICLDPPDPLYFYLTAQKGDDVVTLTIINDYPNLSEITRNGEVIYSNPTRTEDEAHDVITGFLQTEGLGAMLDICRTIPLEELEFLIDAAKNNKKAADAGMAEPLLTLGSTIKSYSADLPKPYNVINKAQHMTAAASEARMYGLVVPIRTIGGSGNHGITNFLGVLTVAEALNASEEMTARALATASVVTACIKSVIRRMTAFCGCAVAAATGVAAATVYLLGGTYEQQELAMQSVIGTIGGMFCDGAKISCCYKLSTAVSIAVEFATLATQNVGLEGGIGILGKRIEETLNNMHQLNDPGMVETEKEILKILLKNQA